MPTCGPLLILPPALAALAGGAGSNIVILIPLAKGRRELAFFVRGHDSAICRTLFPPLFAGDEYEYENHPSRHGSIALPVPEVPKMSVGAICFSSSGSNGGCWVVLVFPRLFFFFFGKMGFFFPYATYAKKKSLRHLHQKKKFPSEKNATYAKKKKLRELRQKKIRKKRLTLISTIELRFPRGVL